MSIFRRGEIWYASYSQPGGQRIKESLGTKDKIQAQELHDKRKAELWRVSRLGEMPDVTFEEACLRWLEEKADKKSIDTDKVLIGFWLNYFEGEKLKSITEAKIYATVSKMRNRVHQENWRRRSEALAKKGKDAPEFLEKQVSTATKAAYLAFMKSLLRAAEREWKWLDKAPIIKIPQPKNRRIRWLEPHEAQRLIDECPEPLKSVVKFALASGLRRSNILDLEWTQIDMQRKVAWIHPEQSKSTRAIGVALNDTACKVLRDQIGRHSKWVFVHTEPKTRSDGTVAPAMRKMRVDSNTAWRLAKKRAGIENFRFHDLRHTWASWLIQSGVPLSILQEMGGWESIEMVRRYAHLAPDHLTEHSRQIDAIFAECVPILSHQKKSDGTNNA
jgi:integrase